MRQLKRHFLIVFSNSTSAKVEASASTTIRLGRTLLKTISNTNSPFVPGGTLRVAKCSFKLSIATSSNPAALTTSTGDVRRRRAFDGAGALALAGADNR